MRNSDVSAHSDSEIPPLKRWFQDTYSREYLCHPHQSSFEYASMSFHSPYKSPGRSHSNVDYSAASGRRFRTTSLSPRYLSPIANQSASAFEDEYVMGCSVCGTKAIEDASWTYHDSPPRMRPSNKPELVNMDQENSGAYSAIISCRLHKAYTWLADAVSAREIKLLEGKLEPESNPFDVMAEATPTTGAVAQTTVLKEVFPSPSVPLTPLNYEDANLLKESFFYNSLAEKYVREEERQRVVTRRAEYANRVKGFTRVVEFTKMKSEGDKNDREMKGEEVYTDSIDVRTVPMDQQKETPERKEMTPESGVERDSQKDESMEERKREGVRVKAPSSFRVQQRHNTAQDRSDHEVITHSPAAESEDMTESTGKPNNSQLARKKLEEIKMTVKQRREERKNKETGQGRQITGGSQRDSRRNSSRERKGVPTKATSNPDLLTSIVSKPLEKPHPSEERKSAVIGAARLRPEESDMRSSSSSLQDNIVPFVRGQDASSEEEELPPQPTMAAPEEPPLADEEESRRQDSISPIPVDSSGIAGEEKPFGTKGDEDLQEEEMEGQQKPGEGGQGEGEEPGKKNTGLASAAPRATRSKPETPNMTSPRQPTDFRSKPPTPSMANMQPTSFPLRKHAPEAEEEKKSQGEAPAPKGKHTTSDSQRPQQASPGSQVKGKSATGTPQRSPKLSPRPASEKAGQDLGFMGRPGANVKVGESQLRDSRPSTGRQGPPSDRHEVSPPQSQKPKSLSKQPRKKLASGKPTSELASFHKLQDEAATVIQHAARRYLSRVYRHKATQMDSEGFAKIEVNPIQEVMSLLEDDSVLAGLRMLGGFVEYLEAKGLKDL